MLDDADLEPTVQGVLWAIMINSGQACIAGSRLYVQRRIYDRLMQGLADAAAKLRLGDGFQPGVQLGPLVSEKQMRRVLGYIDVGLADGAELVTGGKRAIERGYFVQPTILAEPAADSKVLREEIFGPVLTAMPFDDVEEAIQQANDTQYGLSGAVFTQNLSSAHRIIKRIRSGYLYVNCYAISDPALPFGGFKQSGWGRELGRDGLDSYLETKTAYCRL